MAPVLLHLISLNAGSTEESFLDALRKVLEPERPFYVGKCHHWIHAPHLSTAALIGTGNTVQKWDYLIIHKTLSPDELRLPDGLASLVEKTWSINGTAADTQLGEYDQIQHKRLNDPSPPLPDGWSPDDHSSLDAVDPPTDLDLSLAVSSYPLGSRTDGGQTPVTLKDFVRQFGKQHTGPVNMLNLLSYLPDQRPRYFEYVKAFATSVGSDYGGQAMLQAREVSNWSSKADDMKVEPDAVWYDNGIVFYPSIWHFAKMLEDPGYVDADRRFKQGTLRDNPILCCTEIDVGYLD